MTNSPIFDDETPFDQAMAELLQRANDDGIDVEGGWKCRVDGNGDYHFDVQITKVEYETD